MALIAHFIDNAGIGGAERAALDLCAGLSRRGHRILVLHLGNPRLEAACAARGIACERLRGHAWYGSRWGRGLFAARLGAELRNRHIDLVHSHRFRSVTVSAAASAVAGIPHVASLYAAGLDEGPSGLRRLRFSAASGSTLVTSGEVMNAGDAQAGVCPGSLRIDNGIDAQAFRVPVERPGPFTLIATGQLCRAKCHDVLIDALARVTRPVRLRLVGDGPLQTELMARAKAQGVASRVEFLGFREDVPALLGAAHVFLRASRTGAIARGLMEAMAAGLPAVVSDLPGHDELVEHGVTGLRVATGNAEAFAQAIDALAAEPERASAMGRAARLRVEQHYSLETMVHRYAELYASLLPLRAAS
jgi:glycosyltransferase involved in cell wall biosynthesis